ncbi:38158_t:CDS:2, partial [Gigaspora margarita]
EMVWNTSIQGEFLIECLLSYRVSEGTLSHRCKYPRESKALRGQQFRLLNGTRYLLKTHNRRIFRRACSLIVNDDDTFTHLLSINRGKDDGGADIIIMIRDIVI